MGTFRAYDLPYDDRELWRGGRLCSFAPSHCCSVAAWEDSDARGRRIAMSFGPGYGEAPPDAGKGGLNARTGMTTNTIDYLKQAYSREPCPYGVNTTDVMMRSETPWLSERMAEEVRNAFGPAALGERMHKAPRRERAKPRERKLVGGLHVDRQEYDAAHDRRSGIHHRR